VLLPAVPGVECSWRAGNLLITDAGHEQIRVVAGSTGTFYGQPMTAGDIYTVAGDGQGGYTGDGGPATSADLSANGMTLDAAGNLIIADDFDHRVRVVAHSSGTFYGKLMTAGDIYTVAGNGKDGFSGDGGPATKTAVGGPDGLAVNSAGNLLVTASYEHRVRMVEGG
jgi:hypothetical protein